MRLTAVGIAAELLTCLARLCVCCVLLLSACYCVNALRARESLRCRECGYRIMYKERMRRRQPQPHTTAATQQRRTSRTAAVCRADDMRAAATVAQHARFFFRSPSSHVFSAISALAVPCCLLSYGVLSSVTVAVMTLALFMSIQLCLHDT
jgi:DNA-directed RNA polymerase subunit RPC12/RpoP